MSYGLSVSIPGYPRLNIATGWYPAIYVETVNFYIAYMGSGKSVTRNYNFPSGTILYAVASGDQSDSRPSGSIGEAYNIEVITGNNYVKLVQTFWSGYSSSSFNGRLIQFRVYAYFPQSSPNGYGIHLLGTGVDIALNQNTKLDVLLWKRTDNVGTRDNIHYYTGLPTSIPAPVVYVSDTGRNVINSRVYAKDGLWRVAIQRSGGKATYIASGNYPYVATPPVSGVVRMAVFGQHPGKYQSSWGLALYASNGSRVFSTDYAPLMIRRRLKQPTSFIQYPISSPNTLGDKVGDHLSSSEMAKHPMIVSRKYGVTKIRWYVIPCAFWLKGSGRFTGGFIDSNKAYESGGNIDGVWAEDSGNSRVPMIYGTDYFDDF